MLSTLGTAMMAERCIQEALAKGELNNLAGEGKPLKEKQSATQFGRIEDMELMSVLSESGFKPDFIERNNELKDILPEVLKR